MSKDSCENKELLLMSSKTPAFLGFLLLVTASSCCVFGSNQPPVKIYVPGKRPPVAELLSELGEDPINPILVSSEDLNIHRNELLKRLLLLHGKSELQKMVRHSVGMARVKREGIQIDEADISKRAKEILEAKAISLEGFLEARSIDRLTWVNEIAAMLSFEQLYKYEMIRRGAKQVQVGIYGTEEEAQKNEGRP